MEGGTVQCCGGWVPLWKRSWTYCCITVEPFLWESSSTLIGAVPAGFAG